MFLRRYAVFSAGNPGLFFVDFQLWRRWPGCRAFALISPGAAIAATLTGSPTIAFHHDHLLVKEPGTFEPTPWHHDQPYYPVDGDQIVSLWLPLDPISRETSVEYVKGSHRWGRWFQPRFFRNATDLRVQDPRFEPVPDIGATRQRYELIGWALEPGRLHRLPWPYAARRAGQRLARAPAPRLFDPLARRRYALRPTHGPDFVPRSRATGLPPASGWKGRSSRASGRARRTRPN